MAKIVLFKACRSRSITQCSSRFMTTFLKKYRWWLMGGAAALIVIVASGSGTPSQAPVQTAAVVESQSVQQVSNTPSTPQVQNQTVQQTQPSQTTLSNNNYYTNSSDNTIHSPAYTNNGSVPAGATAQCGDGTYSLMTRQLRQIWLMMISKTRLGYLNNIIFTALTA